jgi:hypothetical protein
MFCNLKSLIHNYQIKTNSLALVCERTIPTERPPLVSEVSAHFTCYVISTTDPKYQITRPKYRR